MHDEKAPWRRAATAATVWLISAGAVRIIVGGLVVLNQRLLTRRPWRRMHPPIRLIIMITSKMMTRPLHRRQLSGRRSYSNSRVISNGQRYGFLLCYRRLVSPCPYLSSTPSAISISADAAFCTFGRRSCLIVRAQSLMLFMRDRIQHAAYTTRSKKFNFRAETRHTKQRRPPASAFAREPLALLRSHFLPNREKHGFSSNLFLASFVS